MHPESNVQVVEDAASVAAAELGPASLSPSASPVSASRANRWLASARFLLAWFFPALLGFYLKWYSMVDQHGFEKVSRSMGLPSLNLSQRLSFFRGEILVGFLIVPLVLLFLNRFLGRFWSAILTGAFACGSVLLLVIQLRALNEVGRYISLNLILTALSWGWHEPGANVGYLAARQLLLPACALVAAILAVIWAAKSHRRAAAGSPKHWKTAVELYLLVIFVLLVAGWRAGVPSSPFHESTFVRAVTSLWNESVVDTGEFSAFDFEHLTRVDSTSAPVLSRSELLARYRDFVHAPAPQADPRYFAKERGANVLFIALETTPDYFLPADDSMEQFPNLARLRAQSFVGERHYTVFPITRAALFSVFSGWYPEDRMPGVWGFPDGDSPPDFLKRLSSDGYDTEVFSPVRYYGELDESLFRTVGFGQQFVPDSAPKGYSVGTNWRQARITADTDTVHLLEREIQRSIDGNHKFAFAFLPQVSHQPYPDAWPADSTENLRERARAMLAMQDKWLGEVLDLLQKRGQLDKTIIVVLGDHGTRSRRENPYLRWGTIDETAFHVPLLIYAPRALFETQRIPWLTSHIDVVPTVLDLLGEKAARENEQGTAVWNPALADRTTFFFAGPVFGADGYQSDGKFFMWHYLSDSVYVNSQAVFDTSDIVPRQSPVARDVTFHLATIIALEKAWHVQFAAPAANGANPHPASLQR
ncbi:MAG: sulfatase-like hydrolase/transferase [Candidatus Acidiferrales bacterium]